MTKKANTRLLAAKPCTSNSILMDEVRENPKDVFECEGERERENEKKKNKGIANNGQIDVILRFPPKLCL